jgi:hypothetical protein
MLSFNFNLPFKNPSVFYIDDISGYFQKPVCLKPELKISVKIPQKGSPV